MEIFLFAAAAVCAYLIGGLNPAIVFSRRIYKRDIRTCGSGNPGFTNFKRTFGNRLAWLVLVLDLTKAAAVAALFAQLFAANGYGYQLGASYTGLFAMLGHAYPPYYHFQGGKGFLVCMSVMWLVSWQAGLVALVLMLLLLAVTRYMSLSTVIAMLSCPITLLVQQAPLPVILLCTASVLFMVFRHRENFIRLKNGTENRFSLKSHPASRTSQE